MDEEVAGWIRPADADGETPASERRPLDRTSTATPKPASKKSKKADPARLEAILQGRKASLCVDNISVSFDGFKALNQLTLILDEGELRCLIGPNGAGKTTLMDVITGKTRPDEGSVFLVGYARDLTSMTEYEIATLGIGRKFQRPTVFLGHTVFENLELALAGDRSVFKSIFKRLSGAERETIDRALETVGLKDAHDRDANVLSHGQKQWLEIGMLLVQNPKILLVDEPVAGMTHQEMDRTAELLVSLAGKHTVVVVEHDMDFVRSIAKQVTVLHEGTVLAEGTLDEVKANPRVVEVYLGDPDA
jgi:urea transport system ATP-binding protein